MFKNFFPQRFDNFIMQYAIKLLETRGFQYNAQSQTLWWPGSKFYIKTWILRQKMVTFPELPYVGRRIWRPPWRTWALPPLLASTVVLLLPGLMAGPMAASAPPGCHHRSRQRPRTPRYIYFFLVLLQYFYSITVWSNTALWGCPRPRFEPTGRAI